MKFPYSLSDFSKLIQDGYFYHRIALTAFPNWKKRASN